MILAHLEKAFGSLTSPTSDELRQALLSLPLTLDALASCIPEPTDLPYGRKVLYASAHVEIVLILLPPNQESAPHNHGRSFGWERVVVGDLTNVIYSLTDDGKSVRPKHTVTVGAGECCYVAQGEFHAIRNLGDSPVVSLNAYAPPLAHCLSFSCE